MPDLLFFKCKSIVTDYYDGYENKNSKYKYVSYFFTFMKYDLLITS